MKGIRIVVAGIVGGIVMFMWGFVSHTQLPFGEMGVESLPDEAVVMPALSTSLNHGGFYLFPARSKDATEAELTAWAEKYTAGPRGVVIFDPEPGVAAMGPEMLGTEFASNVLASLLAALVLASVAGGPGRRVIVGTGIGLIAWISVDVSYWNWYRFPTEMIKGEFLCEVIGWALTSLAIALVLGSARKVVVAAAPGA